MSNYFNTLSLHGKLDQLGKCRSMSRDEFKDGCNFLRGKKIVIVGCGAQGLNQGLNMRDSGLDVSYALREGSIKAQHKSWHNAVDNGFKVGTYEEMIPTADLVINLTPDKQHSSVVNAVMPLMKPHSALGYSHGFNIVEVGQQIRKDITVALLSALAPRSAMSSSAVSAFLPLSPFIPRTILTATAGQSQRHGAAHPLQARRPAFCHLPSSQRSSLTLWASRPFSAECSRPLQSAAMTA